MDFDFTFFLLLMSNGVLIGLMYSLIALGFVLVYKATDAINFAQGGQLGELNRGKLWERTEQHEDFPDVR